MKKADKPGQPNILYSAKDMRVGVVTNPLGEYKVGDW